MHVAKTRIFDKHGFGSKNATNEFIQKVNEFNPDIIHLHNIHGYYLNIEILFQYLKQKNKKVIWTFHDCWPFTGHCAYYLSDDCYKWENKCSQCPFNRKYPKSYYDNSVKNFENKKIIFTQLGNNLNIVSVSNWLENEIRRSFFKDMKIYTIQNGIDIQKFCYHESNFRLKYNLKNKRIILGVSNIWNEKKGFDDFIELSNKLDGEYQLVLVGLSKKQLKTLPSKILGIQNTSSIDELVEIYSAADIYVNLSKEETFGLTNYEAQACGTTVITYASGGTPETLINKNTYIARNLEDVVKIIQEYDYSISKEKDNLYDFDKNRAFKKYIELYKEILNEDISNRS